MTTIKDPSVVVHAFEGGGDDMDAPIKTVVTDPVLAAKHGLCSVNSVNWGRVCVQQIHYFWAYLRATRQVGEVVDFSIPTGAMGNVCAGMYTRRMGLPIGTLLVGTNSNDIAHRTFTKGEFHKQEMKQTLSEAINIQVPYNMERFFHFLAGETHPAQVRTWMDTLEATQQLTFEKEQHQQLAKGFASRSIDDTMMKEAMARAWNHCRYLTDPHTAVALAAAQQWFDLDPNSFTFPAGRKDSRDAPNAPLVILSTAHAAKFEESVRAGLGDRFWAEDMVLPASAAAVMAAEEVKNPVFRKEDDWTERLKQLLDAPPIMRASL